MASSPAEVVGTSFSFYSAEEIRALSVKRVTQPLAFDSLNNPVLGGVYDPALGPTDLASQCGTCHLSYADCPGHMGHVELCVPVYHPLLVTVLFRLLRAKCFQCHRLRLIKSASRIYYLKLLLASRGRLADAMTLDDKLATARKGTVEEMSKAEEELLSGVEASCRASRPVPPSTAVHEYRTALIKELLADIPTKSCSNCRAPAVSLRKDGYSKFFQRELPDKAKRSMAAMGLSFATALDTVRAMDDDGDAGKARRAAGEEGQALLWDGDGSGSEEEPAGEDLVDNAAQRNEDDDDGSGDVGMTASSAALATPAKAAPKPSRKAKFMPPSEVESQMRLLWLHEFDLCNAIWAPHTSRHARPAEGWQVFFVRVLPVTPSRFRPPTRLGENTFEHPQNVFLTRVLNLNERLAGFSMGADDSDEEMADGAPASATKGSARKTVRAADRPLKDLSSALSVWIDLQEAVNALFDSAKASGREAQASESGIRQLLEKKDGLFRKNMMGKRVNFAARSVISPDPFIRTDEIGVPLRFAKKLSYPEPVTTWNVSYLRKLVCNGADVHPGATHVEDEQGRTVDLSRRSEPERAALAKQLLTASTSGGVGGGNGLGVKRVWRHLRDGDVVLMNRQPTLHKPSIMAHRARVLRGAVQGSQQTIRMHYANCKTYNADFDGDEMNMHFPQDELCRAEAYEIAATQYQYLVPTNGEPLRGLIQDHICMAVVLTMRDTFLTRDQYQQLSYVAVEGLPRFQADPSASFKTLPPAILKPQPLWTGKQVISTLLLALTGDLPEPACHFNMDGKCKIKADMWGTPREDARKPGDHFVCVRDNQLLTGVLDKSQIGATAFGLVHSVYELYGAHAAGSLLSALSRLLTVFLQQTAVTCAVDDLLLTDEAEGARARLVDSGFSAGVKVAAKWSGASAAVINAAGDSTVGESQAVDPSTPKDPDARAPGVAVAARNAVRTVIRERLVGGESLDPEAAYIESAKLDDVVTGEMAPIHSDIIKECLPRGQTKLFPKNCLSLIIFSGAKGSLVNHAMIACGLGQQTLEGRRVPRMVSGKTLPSFVPYDPSPRAGGHIADRFLTGLRPQDYFFHCMSGREGLVDTAVKTSRSGYLQRCLVKHLEDLQVNYDYTVRDSNGGIVQFVYGEDAVDTTATGFLAASDERLTFMANNTAALTHRFGLNAESAASSHMDFVTAAQLHREVKVANMAVRKASRVAAADGDADMESDDGADDEEEVTYKVGDLVEVLSRRDTNEKFGTDNAADSSDDSRWLPALVNKVKEKHGKVTLDVTFLGGGAVKKVPSAVVRPVVSDPVLNRLNLGSHVGAVSERMQEALASFADRNPGDVLAGDGEEPGSRLPKLSFLVMMWVKYLRSMVAPGEPVGALAAQSVGEPSTQMTLNTFHLAGSGGVNVTLGIPRLREIVMTASQSIKTPAMTIPLKRGLDRSVAIRLARKLDRLTVAQLLGTHRDDGGIRVVERFRPAIPGVTHSSAQWRREYLVRLYFADQRAIEATFGLSQREVAEAVGAAFVGRLLATINKDMRKSGARIAKMEGEDDDGAGVPGMRLGVAKGAAAPRASAGAGGDADMESSGAAAARGAAGGDSGSEADSSDDDDAEQDGTLQISRKKEVQGYGADSDDDGGSDKEVAAAGDAQAKTPKKRPAASSGSDSDSSSSSSSDDSSDDEGARPSASPSPSPSPSPTPSSRSGNGVPRSAAKSRTGAGVTNRELSMSQQSWAKESAGAYEVGVSSAAERNKAFGGCVANDEEGWVEVRLVFPASAAKVLVLSAAERAAEISVIRATKNITRCVVNTRRLPGSSEERLCVQTEGVNLPATWEEADAIDTSLIDTNDIGAILHTYGVEAARSGICKEVTAVFGVYGISVDPRHLGLIADYMTSSGGYRSLNRIGMNARPSPYLKMSFETTTRFLTEACLHGETENMDSPSARIVMGRVVKSGTGAFDLLHPIAAK